MKIIHIRDAENTPDEVYIGRPRSPGYDWGYGNPFPITHMRSRAEAIAQFGAWANHSPDPRAVWIRENVHNLKGKTLVCYCHPEDCHGRVLLLMAEAANDPC